MQSLIAFLRVAHVWLTAVMVLIAGSPYIVCHCPDGHRKLFCVNSSVHANGCCGGSSYPDSSKQKPSCCQSHKGQSDASSGTRCRVDSRGCSKVLTPPAVVAVSDSRTTAASRGADATPLAALAELLASALCSDFVLSPLSMARGPEAWRDHHSPPPPDLIVTLRHLLV